DDAVLLSAARVERVAEAAEALDGRTAIGSTRHEQHVAVALVDDVCRDRSRAALVVITDVDRVVAVVVERARAAEDEVLTLLREGLGELAHAVVVLAIGPGTARQDHRFEALPTHEL